MTTRSLFAVLALLFSISAPSRAFSAVSWDGSSGTNAGDGTNWVGDSVPAANSDLQFGLLSGGSYTVLFPNTVVWAGSVLFNGEDRPAYTFTGSGANSILGLRGDVTVATAGGLITFASSLKVDMTFTPGPDHTIDIVAGASVLVAGTMQGGGPNVIKTGEGRLTLSGANVYTGNTTLEDGVLAIGTSSVGPEHALVSSPVGLGTLFLNGGSLVDAGTSGFELSNPIVVGGTVEIGQAGARGEIKLNGSLSGSGSITVRSASDEDEPGIVILGSTGVNTFSGSVTYQGTGSLMLNGNNAFNGVSIQDGGSLYVGNNTKLEGLIVSSGDFDTGPAGTGWISFSGGTNLLPNGGDFVLANDLFVMDQLTIDLSEGYDLTLGGSINNNEGWGGLTYFGPGVLTLSGPNRVHYGVEAHGGTLRLGSTSDLSDGFLSGPVGLGTLHLYSDVTVIPIIPSVHLANNVFLGAGTHDLSATGNPNDFSITGVVSGSGSLVWRGAQLTLAGDNTFGGGLTLYSGVLVLGSSSETEEGETTADNSEFARGPVGTGTLTLKNGVSVRDPDSDVSLANNIVLYGAVTIGADGNSDYTLGGSITGSGGIDFQGHRLTLLYGGNEFTGGLRINGGHLRFGTTTILEGENPVAGPAGIGGSLTLTGGSELEIWDGIEEVAIYNPILLLIENNAAGNAIRVHTGIQHLALYGDIGETIEPAANEFSGARLIKDGDGTLLLGGTSTFSGGVLLDEGTIELASSSLLIDDEVQGPLGSGVLVVEDNPGNGIKVASGAESVVLHNDILLFYLYYYGLTIDTGSSYLALLGDISATTSDGYLVKRGSGGLKLAGANTFPDGVAVEAGTLFLGSSSIFDDGIQSGPVGKGDLALAADTILAVETATDIELHNLIELFAPESGTVTIDTMGTASLALLGPISETLTGMTLLKTGSGTLTLGGESDFTGGFDLRQGTLLLASSSGMYGTGPIGSGWLWIAPDTTLGVSAVYSGGEAFLDNRVVLFIPEEATGDEATIDVAEGLFLGLYGDIDDHEVESPVALRKTGLGELYVAGLGDFGGGLTVDAGVLVLGSSSLVADNVFVAGPVGIGPLTLGNGVVVQVEPNDIEGDPEVTLANSVVLPGGAVTIDLSLVETVETGAYDLSLTGAISGAGGLTLEGDGTLRLSSSNGSWSGGLTVDGSNLVEVWNNASLGTGPLTLSGTGAFVNFKTGVNAPAVGSLSGVSGTTLDFAQAGAQLTVSQSVAGTFAGIISGTTGLRKDGSAKLTLSGSNTYDGATRIDSGILAVSVLANGGSPSSIGQSGAAAGNLILNGGTLQYVGSGATTDRLFTLKVPGGTIDSSGTGALVFSDSAGAIAVDSAGTPRILTLAGSNTGANTLQPAVGDAISLVKTGAGHWILAGNNGYTGGTTISAGTLQIGAGGTTGSIVGDVTNNGTLVFDRSNALTFAGAITGTGGLVKDGAGTLTLTGDSAFSGGTIVDEGTLRFGNGGTSGSVAGNILNSGTVIFDRSNATQFSGVISGAGSLEKFGASTLTLTGNNTYAGGTIIHAGTLMIGQTTSGAIAGDVMNNGTLGFSRSGFVTTTFNGTISGAGSLFKAESSTLVPTAANSYTGATTIAAGAIRVSSLADGGSNSNIGASSSAASNLVLDGGRLEFAGGTLVTDRLFTLGTNSGALKVISGSVEFTNPGAIAVLGTNARSIELDGGVSTQGTLASAIPNSASGAVGIIKTGSGTWILSGANTYTGTTAVHGGTLIVGADNAIAGSAVSVSFGATLDVANSASITTLTNSGTVTVGLGKMLTLTGTGTLAPVGGSGGVAKAGSGTLTIGTAQAYTGPTQVGSGATLVVGNGATAGSVSGGLVGAGGTLVFDRTDNVDFLNPITGSGTLQKLKGGVLRLLADGSYNGSVTISGGTLQYGDGGTAGGIFASPVDIAGNTLAINRSNNVTLAGMIQGGGTLQKSGAGRLDMNGSNLFSGTVNVLGGTLAFNQTPANTLAQLQVASGARFEANRSTVVTSLTGTGELAIGSGRQFTYAGPGSSLFGGVVSGGGSLKLTGGTLILGQSNTYAGSTNVFGGTLALASPGGLSPDFLTLLGTNGTPAILATNGTFSRTFGTNANQVALVVDSLAGGAGFAAYGGALNITNLTGTWGTTSSFFNGTLAGPLVFGRAGLSDNVVTWSGNIDLGGASRTIQVDDNSASAADKAVVAGVVSNGALVKTGTGRLELTGVNTYAGGTTITAGTVVATNSSSLGTGSLVLDGGMLDVASGITLGNSIGFGASGGKLGGTGTYTAPLVVSNNVILAPGNSPGTLTFTAGLTLAAGGAISFDIQDAAGVAGTGFDLIAVSGMLAGPGTSIDIAATSATPFTIQLVSLNGTSPGAAANFDPLYHHKWTIATAAEGISGFASNKFVISTAGFTNELAGGTFGIGSTATSLELTFTPVPEPSTWAMMIAGATALAAGGLRRRKKR